MWENRDVNVKRWEEANLKYRRNLAIRERRIRLFNIQKHKSILDFGCGDGLNLKIFRKLGYTNIYGLDKSESYISKLRQEFKVYLADACDTGLPSKSFDVIFIDSVLHHLEMEHAFKEIKRILKNGGELCFIEPRNNLARRVLDFITLSPVSASFGPLKNRRVTLIEEHETYENWSKQQSFLVPVLNKFGFRIIFRRKFFITMVVKCLLKKSEPLCDSA